MVEYIHIEMCWCLLRQLNQYKLCVLQRTEFVGWGINLLFPPQKKHHTFDRCIRGGSKTVQNRQEKIRFGRQLERQTHLTEIPVMGRLFQHYHLKKIY